MTRDEFITFTVEKLRGDVRIAQDGLVAIANGKRHFELDGAKPLDDVTDARAQQYRDIITHTNELLAQYGRIHA